MDFVRKIIDSDDIESIVSLPNDLKNKKVEILNRLIFLIRSINYGLNN